jgi:hypothetical protein
MHKGKPISEQQYKTPSADEYYVFMPLSHAGDQAVFQNIQRLAKCYRTQHGAFYDLVRDIRSKMTRIKLAAEHDMATNFVRVARQQPDDARPKFKFSLMEKTDVSIRDKGKGLELKLTTSVLKPPEQVTFDGDSKVKQANVTPEILQARQVAAINFQKLILGELHSYGEVVVAYRQHKGAFPKFAQFDDTSKLWKVGTLGADGHTFNFTGETIPDQPKLT